MSARLMVALCATAAIVTIAGTRTTLAQNTDQPAAAGGSGLEEIVVTARRREERIQTVPMAITAFSTKDLDARSIVNYTDLQHDVPSFTYSPTQRSGIGSDPTIRGLPGVVTYFSEVPLIEGNLVGNNQAIDNSVQVLKGPAGHFVRAKHDRRRGACWSPRIRRQHLEGICPGSCSDRITGGSSR